MAYIASQVGPSCLTQADSEGAAPIHWLCTLGGSMRHAATSAMAMPHERHRSWAHGAPPVRANISTPASSAAAGAVSAKNGNNEEGKEGEKAKDLGVDLRGCSVAVVAKVRGVCYIKGSVPSNASYMNEDIHTHYNNLIFFGAFFPVLPMVTHLFSF